MTILSFFKRRSRVDTFGEPTPKWVQGPCYHLLRGGMGMMGDAYTCTKCGYSKYPESFPDLWRYEDAGRVTNGDTIDFQLSKGLG